MRRAPEVTADLAVVLLFVVIGRNTHAHGLAPDGLASTAWPFVVGLAVGWSVVLQRGWAGSSLGAGVTVWIATVGLGMVLRVVAGQGTAVAFVLVALGFLGAAMLGWRGLAAAFARSGRGRQGDGA